MKKFLYKLFIFFIPIFAVSIIADVFISKYLRKTNQYRGELEVWNDIYTSKANCDIAIYGTSRAFVQYNPIILDSLLKQNVYNFGLAGQNFWIQYLRHLEYTKYNKKPKKIILDVFSFSLFKGDGIYNHNQFLPFMFWNKEMYNFLNSYSNFNTFDFFIPIIRYSGNIKNIKMAYKIYKRDQELTKKFRYKGYHGNDEEWNEDLDKAKSKYNQITVQIHYKSVKLFEKFIEECKIKNIELIFVYSPEHIDGQNFVSNRKEIINLYRNYSKKYNIRFIDFSKDSLCFDKKYFYNSTHLNKLGSEIFSIKLAKLINQN